MGAAAETSFFQKAGFFLFNVDMSTLACYTVSGKRGDTMQQERFEEFASLIGGIYGDIQKLKTRHTAHLGLKSVHIFWLYLLRTHPEGLSASELAAAGRSNRSLVSREIDALVEQGLICNEETSARRRYGWKFVLTEQGVALAEEISRIAKDVQNTVNHGIPTEDLVVFYRTLNALARHFDALTNQ